MSKSKASQKKESIDLERGIVQVRLTGTHALLMHDCSKLANPRNEITKAIKEITKKGKKKTDDDHQEISRLEFLGGLYHDEQIGPYIPGQNIEACLREAAAITRQKKDVLRAITVAEFKCPLIYPGPRGASELWEDSNFVDFRCIGIQKQSKVFRTRPIFRQWAVEATICYMGDIVDIDSLKNIMTRAGELVGLGDYRPRFGKFEWEFIQG